MNWKSPIILGAIAGSGEFLLREENSETDYLNGWRVDRYISGNMDLHGCKLIARNVGSITDEELRHYQYEIPLKDISIGNNLTMETPEPFLYLLSIGVLPESLADEDVIWK